MHIFGWRANFIQTCDVAGQAITLSKTFIFSSIDIIRATS